MNIPSKSYKEWQEEKMWELKSQRPKPATSVERVEITLFSPDKRSSDLTNKAESVMDLLVDYGTLKDDNWFEIPQVLLKFGGVDKSNPRAEIVITEYN